MAKISETGVIGHDGKLRLPQDRVTPFFVSHKGQRVIVTFEAVEPHSSLAQIAYYYKYCVPTIRKAFMKMGVRMTDNGVDEHLLRSYPGEFTLDENLKRPRHGSELNKGDMSDFLDWLKEYAAENLEVYIEDSKTL